jgi:LAS superfamily LD-carboxypeptidase LdcB
VTEPSAGVWHGHQATPALVGHRPISKRPQTHGEGARVAEILRLQRTAGNSAVAALLAVQRTAGAPTLGNRTPSNLVIQTKDDTAPAAPDPKKAISPSAQGDLATLIDGLLPMGMQVGGALDQVLRAAGADLAGTVIESLIRKGYRDESKLTNIAFWLHHPDLTGEDLHRDQPGFAALSKEWLDLRTMIVRPALEAPVKATAPQSADQPPTPATKDVTDPGPGATPKDFVKDWARSTLELLPEDQRKEFEAVQWGRLDFPGTQVPLKGLKDDEADWWRKQPSVIEIPGPNGYFTGANQTLAGKLFYKLSKVRPGGGERRVNIGSEAVVPQKAFDKDPESFYKYVTDELDGIPGQTSIQMNTEAAAKFAEMREAAKADGVRLIALNAFRPLEHERKAEKAAANRNAVGGISHLIGLAVDVRLHVDEKADPQGFTETGTGNFPGMLGMMHSPVYKWIFMNGSKFSFYQYRQEPWHWEYNPPGFRERFYAKAPGLKEKAEDALLQEKTENERPTHKKK